MRKALKKIYDINIINTIIKNRNHTLDPEAFTPITFSYFGETKTIDGIKIENVVCDYWINNKKIIITLSEYKSIFHELRFKKLFSKGQ